MLYTRLAAGSEVRKFGIRASHTAEVILGDVRVPGRYLVSEMRR